MSAKHKVLNELKLFIYEENRDFSSDENMIITVIDTMKFIHEISRVENNTKEMINMYSKFLAVLSFFEEEMELVNIKFGDIK